MSAATTWLTVAFGTARPESLGCLGYRALLPGDCEPAADASNLWPSCSNLCNTEISSTTGGVCECYTWEEALPNGSAVAPACGGAGQTGPPSWSANANTRCSDAFMQYVNGTLADCQARCVETAGCSGFSARTAGGAVWTATRGLVCTAEYEVHASLDVAACQRVCDASPSCSGFSWPASQNASASGCAVHTGVGASCAPQPTTAPGTVYWALDRAAEAAARGGCRVHIGSSAVPAATDCTPVAMANHTYYSRGVQHRIVVLRALSCGTHSYCYYRYILNEFC